MGYTHYWNRKQGLTDVKKYRAIVEDFRKLLAEFKERDIDLADGFGENDAVVSSILVWFNGRDEDSHETFHFPPEQTRETFNFTKTARKPYDLAVTCFLIIAKHHLGNEIEVSSDGEKSDWLQSRELCNRVLGYGEGFKINAEVQ